MWRNIARLTCSFFSRRPDRAPYLYAAQSAITFKTACAALPCQILNDDVDIEISNELKTLISKPVYWKGVAVMESFDGDQLLFDVLGERRDDNFSRFFLCVLRGDQVPHKTLNRTLLDAFLLNNNSIDHKIAPNNQRFATIFSEAHGLTFVNDPLFSKM